MGGDPRENEILNLKIEILSLKKDAFLQLKELETTKKLLDEAVKIIQNTAHLEGDRAFKFLAKHKE